MGTLTASGALSITGDATFAGLSGGQGGIDVLSGGTVSFQNISTIDNVDVLLSGTLKNYVISPSGSSSSGTLTLGNSASIIETGAVGNIDASVVNDGTISASQPGGWIIYHDGLVNNGLLTVTNGAVMGGDGSFQNSGSISVSNGGDLYLGYGGYSVINTGHITETDATIVLYGTTTLDLLNSIDRSGGLIRLGGTLALGGGTLDVGNGTALGQLLDNGVISGGTIHDAGGGLVFEGQLIAGSQTYTGTLSDVTYEGTANLIPAQSTLTVTNGLTVTGTNGQGEGTVNLLGNISELSFVGSQTLDNVTINVGDSFDATNLRVYSATGAPAVLTLGANANITQWGARAAIDLGWGYGYGLVNDGVIGAVAQNGAMLIQNGTFTNNGTVVVGNGETLNLQVDDFANLSGSTLNGGSWTVNDRSTLDLGYNNQVATLNAALYLGGPGAVVQSLNSTTGLETTLNQSLQTVAGGGDLVLANGATLNQPGLLRDEGRIVITGGTLGAQPLAIFPKANVTGYGTLVGTIWDSGIVMAQGGNLAIDGAFYPGGKAGAAWINIGATLTASSALAVSVRFIGSTGELVLEQANAKVGTISGFTGSDVIDLRNVSATGVSLNFSGGVLTVATNGTTDAALRFAGNYVTGNFSATSDGHGGTLIKDPPVSFTSATLTAADLGGADVTGGGSRSPGGAAGTIAVPSVVGMAVGTEPTQGGALTMLNVGH